MKLNEYMIAFFRARDFDGLYVSGSLGDPLASCTHIWNGGHWISAADFGQQLSIRQDQSKPCESKIQFMRNALVSIPGELRVNHIQAQHFFTSQAQAREHNCTILANKI